MVITFFKEDELGKGIEGKLEGKQAFFISSSLLHRIIILNNVDTNIFQRAFQQGRFVFL